MAPLSSWMAAIQVREANILTAPVLDLLAGLQREIVPLHKGQPQGQMSLPRQGPDSRCVTVLRQDSAPVVQGAVQTAPSGLTVRSSPACIGWGAQDGYMSSLPGTGIILILIPIPVPIPVSIPGPIPTAPRALQDGAQQHPLCGMPVRCRCTLMSGHVLQIHPPPPKSHPQDREVNMEITNCLFLPAVAVSHQVP